MRKTFLFAVSILLAQTISAQDKKPEIYNQEKIFAPVVVADLPGDAFQGLCYTKDGKIRHYNTMMLPEGVKDIYLESSDNGLSWTLHDRPAGLWGPMVMKSPYSRYWVGVLGDKVYRSKTGLGDTKSKRVFEFDLKDAHAMDMIALKSRQRFVAVFSTDLLSPKTGYHASSAYSDDDGLTWTTVPLAEASFVPEKTPGDQRVHWYCNGSEPSIAELSDGTLLVVARTSGPWHTFYKSSDGGETWSEPYFDKNFWSCNTTPNLHTLSDGRLLFIWNNTAILPTRDISEYPELTAAEREGVWESVFTNRDVLHAAISDDDGKTWHGFREIALNEIRNYGDFRQYGGWPLNGHDRSVHMTSVLELPDGNVLLAYGQERSSAKMLIFDPDWLYETSAMEDFRSGYAHISNHLYVNTLSGGRRKWAGHAQWNRVPGALLVKDPDAGKGTQKDVLQICRICDPRLVSDRQGVAWNFPATKKGTVTTECRIDGEGFQLAICDHWMNPCDEVGPKASPVVFKLTRKDLPQSGWYKVSVEWDFDTATATLLINDKECKSMKIESFPPSGLSYLHLQTLAESYDPYGSYFKYFKEDGAL